MSLIRRSKPAALIELTIAMCREGPKRRGLLSMPLIASQKPGYLHVRDAAVWVLCCVFREGVGGQTNPVPGGEALTTLTQ